MREYDKRRTRIEFTVVVAVNEDDEVTGEMWIADDPSVWRRNLRTGEYEEVYVAFTYKDVIEDAWRQLDDALERIADDGDLYERG